MKQYFEILGLEDGASQQQIHAAYKRLSKELNPEKNNNELFFIEEYKKVKEAFEALSNSSILATDNGAKSTKNIKSIKPIFPSENSSKTYKKRKKRTKWVLLVLLIFVAITGIVAYTLLQP